VLRIARGLAIGLVFLLFAFGGTILVAGRGSPRSGAARLLKAGAQWFLGLRGPVLRFWGQPDIWVELEGTRAFVASTFEALIFDVSVDGTLRLVSSIPMGGLVHGFAVCGNILYVAAGDGGLVVVDITAPDHPLKLITIESFGYTLSVTRHGDRLYTMERQEGVRVFDVSDPRRPRQVGAFRNAHWTNNAAVSDDGRYVYVTDADRGLIVLDAGGGGDPVERATLPLPPAPDRMIRPIDPAPLNIQYRDGFVYMAAVDRGLVVADVRRPEMPRLAALLRLPGDSVDVRLQGNRAFVAQEPVGVAVVDISRPEAPRLVHVVEERGCPHSVAVSGSRALVALVGQGVDVLDISDADLPHAVAEFVPTPEARNVAVAGSFAYVAQGSGGLQIYDVREPWRPRLVSTRATRDYDFDVRVVPPLAYLAEGSVGFTILNLSDPAHPVALSTTDTPEHAFSIAVASDRLYTAEGMYGFEVADTTDLRHPRVLGAGTKDGYTFCVLLLSARLLAVADFFGGLRLVDVGSPAAPDILWTGPRNVTRMATDGHLLYFVSISGKLGILNVDNPRSPVLLGNLSLSGSSLGLAVRDGLAAVAADGDGVQLVDVHDPASPRLLGGARTNGHAWGLTFDRDLLFVADGDRGLSVVNVSDPEHPRLVSPP
jgi:hypothetical protein